MNNKYLQLINYLKTYSGRRKIYSGSKKYLRTYLSIASSFLNRGYSITSPAVIAIEVTNKCNLKCKMCPRNKIVKEEKIGDMPDAIFEKITPFLKGQVQVILQGAGEPLLADNFFKYLEICKKNNCYVTTTTNGTLMNEAIAISLIKSKIDIVNVSIDGTSNYEDIRGFPLDKVLSNLKLLSEVKRNLNSSTPLLSIYFIGMKKNIRELIELVRIAGEYKIDMVWCQHLQVTSSDFLGESLLNCPELAKDTFNKAQDLAKKLGISLILPPLEQKNYFCVSPFQFMTILFDGKVTPCCYGRSLVVGDLNKSEIKEIWNGGILRKLRVSLLKNFDLPSICNRCYIRVFTPENVIDDDIFIHNSKSNV